MRMSHIYQPVMILELLKRNGLANKRDIAEAILSYDESQKEYYEKITTSMVGKVLTKNNNITSKKKIYTDWMDLMDLNRLKKKN